MQSLERNEDVQLADNEVVAERHHYLRQIRQPHHVAERQVVVFESLPQVASPDRAQWYWTWFINDVAMSQTKRGGV